jgi:hypothetical protein
VFLLSHGLSPIGLGDTVQDPLPGNDAHGANRQGDVVAVRGDGESTAK